MPKQKQFKEIPEEDKALAGYVDQKFKEAMVAKEKFTADWLTYLNAWDGSLFTEKNAVPYRTNHVSNFIYSTIESMRPILFDHDPRFEAIPVTAEGMPYTNDINAILDWEWHRTNIQELLLANSIFTFTLGTSIVMLNYKYGDSEDESVDGEVEPVKISPFNIFPDALATSVEDAEYIIYADYKNVNLLKKMFPSKAQWLTGGDVKYSELVAERSHDARIDNQVLVLEMWCRDYTSIEVEEDENGEKIKKRKYPNGRVITAAPELGLILEDKANPYSSGRFPFFVFKDIDVPFQFWGEGEVKWLMSPQREANDLYNQIIDNAKHTANMQWIIDKNAGIPKGELSNRPGLIVRKNPGTTVERTSPPSMPAYVANMIDVLKTDIEVISGVHDVTRGETPTGIQSAAAIQALQEAAQTRVRLKITLHENALGVLGTEWLNRIKQYWKFDRLIPRKTDKSQMVAGDANLGLMPDYQMIQVQPEVQLQHNYRVKVIGASFMENNRASMLDQMIRLAQTPAEDGLPMVPREAVLDYLPNVNKQLVLEYYQQIDQKKQAEAQSSQMSEQVSQQLMAQIQQLAQQVQEIGQVVGQLQQRAEKEDEEARKDELMNKGYQRGLTDAQVMQTQMEKSGQLPPELLEELDQLSDDELAQVIQENPELVEIINNLQ